MSAYEMEELRQRIWSLSLTLELSRLYHGQVAGNYRMLAFLINAAALVGLILSAFGLSSATPIPKDWSEGVFWIVLVVAILPFFALFAGIPEAVTRHEISLKFVGEYEREVQEIENQRKRARRIPESERVVEIRSLSERIGGAEVRVNALRTDHPRPSYLLRRHLQNVVEERHGLKRRLWILPIFLKAK